jgi:hypothetical protein
MRLDEFREQNSMERCRSKLNIMLTDCGVTFTMGTIQADVHDTVRRITTPGCLASAMAKPMYCSDPDAKASILRRAR